MNFGRCRYGTVQNKEKILNTTLKMEKKGSRTMRKTWKKLAAMAVTASMVICGGAMGVSAATEEEKPEKVTVNVAYMPDYASLNGLISAIELGYFDDENIDVQLTEFSDGPTIIQAMESGSIDVDTSDREPTNFASTVKLIFLHLHMYLMVML